MARVRESFAVELPVQVLFGEAATVRELAQRVETARQEGQGPVLALEALPREGSLPLSFAQERLWFLEQLDALGGTYNDGDGVPAGGRAGRGGAGAELRRPCGASRDAADAVRDGGRSGACR